MGKTVKAVYVGNEYEFISDYENFSFLDDDVFIDYREALEEAADRRFYQYLKNSDMD